MQTKTSSQVIGNWSPQFFKTPELNYEVAVDLMRGNVGSADPIIDGMIPLLSQAQSTMIGSIINDGVTQTIKGKALLDSIVGERQKLKKMYTVNGLGKASQVLNVLRSSSINHQPEIASLNLEIDAIGAVCNRCAKRIPSLVKRCGNPGAPSNCFLKVALLRRQILCNACDMCMLYANKFQLAHCANDRDLSSQHSFAHCLKLKRSENILFPNMMWKKKTKKKPKNDRVDCQMLNCPNRSCPYFVEYV